MSKSESMKQNSLVPKIRHLESENRKLKAENALLKERLRIGYKQPKINLNREKIIEYKATHPNATIREIQKALKLSSTRSITYHLERIKLEVLEGNNG